jgi:hypothetical protein
VGPPEGREGASGGACDRVQAMSLFSCTTLKTSCFVGQGFHLFAMSSTFRQFACSRPV